MGWAFGNLFVLLSMVVKTDPIVIYSNIFKLFNRFLQFEQFPRRSFFFQSNKFNISAVPMFMFFPGNNFIVILSFLNGSLSESRCGICFLVFEKFYSLHTLLRRLKSTLIVSRCCCCCAFFLLFISFLIWFFFLSKKVIHLHESLNFKSIIIFITVSKASMSLMMGWTTLFTC